MGKIILTQKKMYIAKIQLGQIYGGFMAKSNIFSWKKIIMTQLNLKKTARKHHNNCTTIKYEYISRHLQEI